MRGIRMTRAARCGLGAMALCLLPVPAQAHSFLLVGPLGPSMLILLGSGSHCVGFTYDANGNRTSQSTTTMGSGATLWGSGPFGCFVWSQ